MPKKRKKTRVKVPIKQTPFYKKKGFILFLAIIAISFGGYHKVKAARNTQVIKINASKNKKIQKEISKEIKEPKKKEKKSTFKDGIFKNDQVEIVFTSAVSGTNYKDEPIAYTFFNITNRSKEDQSAERLFREYVEVYQDLGQSTRELAMTLDYESPFKDELDAMNQIIKPGGTIEVAHIGLLADENIPVSIKFKDNMTSKEAIGNIEVEILEED